MDTLHDPYSLPGFLGRQTSIAMILCALVGSVYAQKLDMTKLENMKARSIGPAGMSGRVTAIAVERKNLAVIYIGSASGGLWKSVSGGVKWDPIFDTMAVASIGAIALDQNNPDAIWVGTGEGNPRNSQTSGNGVYRSLDGGHSWMHLGLEKTRNIHRVILDPTNSNVAYAAAIGTAFGETQDRGVYKTTDGGTTWQRVLFVDEKTGCAELVMDPSNPNKLIAAMWQYRRWPWFFKSGGPGSGLYVTFDGGKTWKKRTDEDGLPKGELGRIGLAISASSPDRVYAIIESKKNALYRSDDGGFKWKKMSDSNNGNRPFYYHEIYVDPTNENRVYSLYSNGVVSEDGGKTFENLIGRIHGDHQAFYIHPDNPNFLVDGNDGGAAISYDRGKTWRFIANLPLGQFYHINADAQTPYNVYGGLQDNGSWRGPAYAYQWSAIRNLQWDNVGWGDGFDVVPDRSDPRFCFSMSQGGYLSRIDMQTNDSRFIRPIHPSNVPLRFNWNAGISSDPFSTTTIYYGSQFLHKSTNRGDTWKIISPDLTTNDASKQKQIESGGLTYDVTAAENYCTIISIAPSPVQQGVIWVGTDDGNVQVTTNGGATWTNVVRNIKGVPESTWIPQIQASTYKAGEAFVVFDNHRRNDWTPYVFHTADFGKSWTRLADDKDVGGYALSLAQDPVEPKLMFVGTEFGLYVSIDGGENWSKWKAGYPTVSTMDLAIQPGESDLVMGTFGRSVFVLDDIRPLREIARRGTTLLDQPLRVFEIPDAALTSFKWIIGGGFGHGDGEFYGENRPYGARISFVVNPPDTTKGKESKDPKKKDGAPKDSSGGSPDTVKIEVLKMDGELLRTLKVSVKKGMNRTTWGLDRKSERMPSRPKPEPGASEPGGWSVMPGTYKVRLTYLKHTDSTTVTVKADPRLGFTEQEMLANTVFFDTLYRRVHVATDAADRLRAAKKTIEQIAGLVKDRSDSTAKKVKDLGNALQDSIKALNEMIDDKEVQGIRNDPSLLESRLGTAVSYVGSSWYPPGETERIALQQAVGSMKKLADVINIFFERDWPRYRDAVNTAKIQFFEPYTPIKVDN